MRIRFSKSASFDAKNNLVSPPTARLDGAGGCGPSILPLGRISGGRTRRAGAEGGHNAAALILPQRPPICPLDQFSDRVSLQRTY